MERVGKLYASGISFSSVTAWTSKESEDCQEPYHQPAIQMAHPSLVTIPPGQQMKRTSGGRYRPTRSVRQSLSS